MKFSLFNHKQYLKKAITITLITLSLLVPFITFYSPINFGDAHSSIAKPMEIFSLWNNTAPTFDGRIYFNATNPAVEWTSAAVYDMFESSSNPNSKIILQNDDNNLYIALDMTDYLIQTPVTVWGCTLYLDRDHNGLLSSNDRSISLLENASGSFVLFNSYSNIDQNWIQIESGTLGSPLPSNILINTNFDSSYFESNNHRQYEIRIPINILGINNGNITGFAAEAFDNYASATGTITWPEFSSNPTQIRTSAKGWGDLQLGLNTSLTKYYAQYVYENNFNIKAGAVGRNNGTYLTTGDINGDGDQELIVGSNRTVSGDSNLLAIYDFVGGEITRIWASWTTSHQANMILPLGIATYDFDGNGEDEIYICSTTQQILRFYNWNSTTNDFENSAYIYTHTRNFMGYLDIGDVDNDGANEIIAGDEKVGLLGGNILIIGYNIGTDSFSLEVTNSPPSVLGNSVHRVHALKAKDMDDDNHNELIYLAQYSTNNTLSPTALLIRERAFLGAYSDNPDDDLPPSSSSTTADQFGHTIIIADVDNDLDTETILVGKNYIKVFGKMNFSEPTPPIQLLLNDGLNTPIFAGGATVGDIDGDGKVELLIGANNGTLYILNVTDSGSDALSYSIEWQSDLGACLGYKEAMCVFDIDGDTENEALIGDNFGQIIQLGSSEPPEVTITSPSFGSTKNNELVYIAWNANDDFTLHHFDIYINNTFEARTGGSQRGITLKLGNGKNNISLICYDVTGKTDTSNTEVYIDINSPEVTIISPENNFCTRANYEYIDFTYSDRNGDFDYYDIYRNSIKVNALPIYEPQIPYRVDLPSDSNWNITVVAHDLALNTGRDTIFIIKDTLAPQIAINSPVVDEAVKDNEVLVQWFAADERSGIDRYDIYRDNTKIGSTTSKSYLVPLSIDKNYIIRIWAYDRASNWQFDSVEIIKDSITPSVIITSHSKITYTSLESINLIWDSIDSYGGSGIEYSTVNVNGLQRYSGVEEQGIINLENNAINNVIVTTYDFAGNSAQDFIIVVVDNNNPFVEVISPINNYNTSFNVITICWNSSDAESGIQQFQILRDGVVYQTITDPEINFASISIPLIKAYTITVRTIDILGYQSEDSIIVNHNPSTIELVIKNPVVPHYYSLSTQILFEWLIANIVDISGFGVYINGILNYTTSNINTRNYLIDFGPIPIDQFPLYNITIIANTTTSGVFYRDYRSVTIDQSAPIVDINLPSNNTIIYSHILYLEWQTIEYGSKIAKYNIKINNTLISTWLIEKSHQYIQLNDTTLNVQITIEAYDLAQNVGTSSIQLLIFLLLPEFSVNLNDTFYLKTGNYQFSLNITNPHAGVKAIYIYIDSIKRLNYDYLSNIQIEPFNLSISITTSMYTPTPVIAHTLRIGIVDAFDRQNVDSLTFYIDNEEPNIISTTINDNALTNGSSERIKIELENGATNFTVKIIVTDNLRIHSVFLRIESISLNDTYQLIPTNDSTNTFGTFAITFNLTDKPLGAYTLVITIFDFAGNNYQQSYDILLSEEEIIPWILQGRNLILILAGVLLFIIFTILFSIAIRKEAINIGWKKDIVTIAYIMNGIPCVYMINKPELVKGELLFGGAMAGIRGVLEEITGEKSKMKIQSVEMGNKKVLICPGNYGDAVLMVNKTKPIHKTKIIEFAKAFEHDYEHLLKQPDLIITPTTFQGANILAQIHFGVSDRMELVDECNWEELGISPRTDMKPTNIEEEVIEIQAVEEEKPEEYIQTKPSTKQAEISPMKKEEITIESIETLVIQLNAEKQKVFLELIETTRTAIDSILEKNYDQTKQANNSMIEKLEILLIDEEIPERLNHVLKSIFIISQELINAIECGLKNDEKGYSMAAKKASTIWIKDITDRW